MPSQHENLLHLSQKEDGNREVTVLCIIIMEVAFRAFATVYWLGVRQMPGPQSERGEYIRHEYKRWGLRELS